MLPLWPIRQVTAPGKWNLFSNYTYNYLKNTFKLYTNTYSVAIVNII